MYLAWSWSLSELSSPSIIRPARSGQGVYKREHVDLARLKIESGHRFGPLQSVSCIRRAGRGEADDGAGGGVGGMGGGRLNILNLARF